MESSNYWCYGCSSFTINSNYRCIHCGSDFIEERNHSEEMQRIDENLNMLQTRLSILVSSIQQLTERIGNIDAKHPLSEERIASLERAHVSGTCSICTEDQSESVASVLLSCGHSYHENCITVWLRIQGTCPQCRKQV
ncbi:unnamed protein product [Blepharisma stoltei]|uniref:RING-type E3 ubiquitin transferase n=1 Tax=Blepharisma stoltei TaxID=1481888 RepID=A0AAU9J7R0_9CILI|nr:unnamed protein product [Blepharisma stoltei]